jgi:DNA-binding response OmpR family regulator
LKKQIIRVTIVEDDSQIAELLNEVLERDGFDVCVLTTGSIHRLLALCLEPPDILICDMNLPGGSGADLCSEALKHFPNCWPILMTGDSSNLVPQPGHLVFPILRKPFTLSSFLHLVRGLAAQRRVYPAAQKQFSMASGEIAACAFPQQET